MDDHWTGATQASTVLRGSRLRLVAPFGLMVHTTGKGVSQYDSPLARAVKLYMTGDAYPHYVIDTNGGAVQTCYETHWGAHAGIDSAERLAYESGSWRSKLPPAVVERWQQRWPGRRSPLNLFPLASPNAAYIGVELIPLNKPVDENWYTQAQYDKLAALCIDIERRYGIELKGARLVGHEDIEPLTRWDRLGGWDPGFLRPKPRFSWLRLQEARLPIDRTDSAGVV